MKDSTKKAVVISAVVILLAGVAYTIWKLEGSSNSAKNKEKRDRKIIIENKNA